MVDMSWEGGRVPSSVGCRHGYPSMSACPRCGVRDAVTLPGSVLPTRWHATDTTMGPLPKLGLTVVVTLPILVCLVGLLDAGTHVENAFLVVPLWFFGVVAAVVLWHTWEPGHRHTKPTTQNPTAEHQPPRV
jgi:hypothetical protein